MPRSEIARSMVVEKSDRRRRPEAMVRANALSTIPDAKVDANLDLIRAALNDEDVIVRGYAIDRYGKLFDQSGATVGARCWRIA